MDNGNDELNTFRQACQTAYDLADWLYKVSDEDATTTKKIKADIRREISVIVQAGEEVIKHD